LEMASLTVKDLSSSICQPRFICKNIWWTVLSWELLQSIKLIKGNKVK
jgi:hypothetical protein